MRKFLYNCELDILKAAAISAYNRLNRIIDNLISDIDSYFYNLFTTISIMIKNCFQTDTDIKVNETTTIIAKILWINIKTINESFSWYKKSYRINLNKYLIFQRDTITIYSRNNTCRSDTFDTNPNFAIN